jgi:effector-binding domain-containing protein
VIPAGVGCTSFLDHVSTHELIPAGPIPTAFDPEGVYPYVSYIETSDRPVLKRYEFVVLENERIRVTICPDRGGRVTSIAHKGSGKEVL